MESFQKGKYQHYKGNFYEVIDIVRHSENFEEFVLYRALYKTENDLGETFWIRPKQMFFENIIVNGVEIPRFKYISEII